MRWGEGKGEGERGGGGERERAEQSRRTNGKFVHYLVCTICIG